MSPSIMCLLYTFSALLCFSLPVFPSTSCNSSNLKTYSLRISYRSAVSCVLSNRNRILHKSPTIAWTKNYRTTSMKALQYHRLPKECALVPPHTPCTFGCFRMCNQDSKVFSCCPFFLNKNLKSFIELNYFSLLCVLHVFVFIYIVNSKYLNTIIYII